MSLIKRYDNFLNNITMYRLLLYGLGILLAIAFVLGLMGSLAISAPGLLASVAILSIVSYGTNRLLGHFYGAATNSESYLITALILACILPPSTELSRLLVIGLAGAIAMASKFVLAMKHKHIFNPAAIAAVVISLSGLMSVTWWIGSPYMLPFTIILGLLIVRKIRNFTLVLTFLGSALMMLLLVGMVGGQVSELLSSSILSGPMIFFAAIMLTEPATMPSSRYYQLLYAVLVGVVYSAHFRYGFFSTTPHMVLAVGNIFAFVVSPLTTLKLRLKEKIQISEQVYDFVFTPDRSIHFAPGQYMEWTLAHAKTDQRGNRRSFTLASSPTETDVHLGIKFYQQSSSFKQALYTMRPGDQITASQLSGDFTLPVSQHEKLVFIAGGVGITPFRSMLKYIVDTGQTRDITLFYIVSNPTEQAYKDVLRSSLQHGVKVIPVLSGTNQNVPWQGFVGPLTQEALARFVPDCADRKFYISGPDGFVKAHKWLLVSVGIHRKNIHTDYFSGY